jgi:choloylglycine hydrolase
MCTGIRFTDGAGNMYFGRNLDWVEDYGECVYITPRNAEIPDPFNGVLKPKYACIGMAIEVDGAPCYFDLANEAGLGVGGLNFPGYAKFADAPVEGTTNVATYLFPLWVAANFKTVAEVREALKNVTIVAKAPEESLGVAQLHWFVGDNKESIVIECQEDGMHIYDNGLDVLTNQPPFPWHYENVRNYMCLDAEFPPSTKWRSYELQPFSSAAGMIGFPGAYDPASRFVRVAFLNAHYPDEIGEEANVTRLFQTLNGVYQVKGGGKQGNGEYEYTIYTGGYSSATQTYYHTLYEDTTRVGVSLKDYDLDGKELIKCA